ncbi:MAG: cupredoxin domain-containing protein [Chloroflexi bacterium]|nr:cupredoxin domain-containing protein [Chloroflexota bacterium]
MKKAGFFLISVLVLSLLLTACGGPSTTMNLTMTDFKYAPMENTIPAGREITVNIKNEGAVIHEYVIMNLGETAGDKFGDEDEGNIYWEVEVDPGKSKTVTFTAPSEAGTYEIVCGTEGHLEAGMTGTLIVVSE